MTEFTVHSRDATKVSVPVKTEDGTTIEGRMPTLIVELLPKSGPTVTLHLPVPTETALKEHDAIRRGAVVAITLSLVKAAPKPNAGGGVT